MKKLSTGGDSTLGEYLRLVRIVLGEGAASAYLNDKISRAAAGADEEVLADENQMVQLLLKIKERK